MCEFVELVFVSDRVYLDGIISACSAFKIDRSFSVQGNNCLLSNAFSLSSLTNVHILVIFCTVIWQGVKISGDYKFISSKILLIGLSNAKMLGFTLLKMTDFVSAIFFRMPFIFETSFSTVALWGHWICWFR